MNQQQLNLMYQQNNDFKTYVDKFMNCKRHKNITLEQALKTTVCRSYADYLINKTDKEDWVLGK